MSKLTELSLQKQKKEVFKILQFYRDQEFLFRIFKNFDEMTGKFVNRDLSYDKLMHSKCRIRRTFNIMDGCKLPVATLENISEHV